MKRKNDTDALERQVKGHPRGYLAEFLVIRSWVAECLKRGHRVRAVFAFLRQEKAISFGLHTFRRYVVRYIPEAERVPEMARGSVATGERDVLSVAGGPASGMGAQAEEGSGAAAPHVAKAVTMSSTDIRDLWSRMANPNAAKGPYVYGADDDK